MLRTVDCSVAVPVLCDTAAPFVHGTGVATKVHVSDSCRLKTEENMKS